MNYSRFCLYGIALIVMISCKKTEPRTPPDPNNNSGYFKSHPVDMGRGEAYAWVHMGTDGKPHSVGLTLTNGALQDLSNDSMGHDPMMTHNIYEMQFPKQALETTPFKHVAINWNPKGHLPGPYALPHFDFHFYTITSMERMAIPSYSAAPNQFNNMPGYDYFPVNYFCPGDTNKQQPVPYTVGPPRTLSETAEPQMGLHWIDITAPELNPVTPKVFTETFVYGSYDGKINYLEPMITLDFIRHTDIYTRTIPRPAKVQITGYYPTTMTLMRNFGDYVIELGNMEYRVLQ